MEKNLQRKLTDENRKSVINSIETSQESLQSHRPRNKEYIKKINRQGNSCQKITRTKECMQSRHQDQKAKFCIKEYPQSSFSHKQPKSLNSVLRYSDKTH